MGITQTERKGLGSDRTRLKRRLSEKRHSNRRNQALRGLWANLKSRSTIPTGTMDKLINALQRSLTGSEIWHMTPLRISFDKCDTAIYDMPSNVNLMRRGITGESKMIPHAHCVNRLHNTSTVCACKAALPEQIKRASKPITTTSYSIYFCYS
ncbi:39S ribosomal protein l19, mitochondrial [Plakobranchus ocellatus]|uniref:39S ribosomal protein l19, mitochondrial n=1 Tax=Plakobranchus ocellatus TaxID=259542 RepID=A0AAV4B632_9GAST|nr:39S ribosomal protein l19, mitochondrial [Plakobranchus ocellatus]